MVSKAQQEVSHDPWVNLRRNSIKLNNLFADKEDLVIPLIFTFLSLSTSKKTIKLEFNFFNFFQKIFNFIYLFIYLWLCWVFVSVRGLSLQLQQVGATLHRGARASHYRGLSRCGAQAPDAQAQQLWLTGLVSLRHVGSSQTRARTCVPCIGRQILNHCATREDLF